MIKNNNFLVKKLIESIVQEAETYYHGTSHFFRCFRTAGVGGGTGAQVYGWGLYFARDFNMADGYKAAGSNAGKQKILFQGRTAEELGLEYECDVFFNLPKDLKTAEEMIEYAEDQIEIMKEDEFEGRDELIAEYERFEGIINELQIETEPMEYVYEVLLHKNKTPDQYEYLDWDANTTTTRQVDKINKHLQEEGIPFQTDESIAPRQIYSQLETYFNSKGSQWPARDASLFLRDAGIDGNTHSNGGVRIIFDEKAIEIVNVCKRNKK